MKIYAVGGAVRDQLLGLPVNDRDWVVVGAGVEDMLSQGFVPVGRDFPVFLHPETHEEYALARSERKTAPGYHGFVFHTDKDVTLAEDLARRDLTINAMALSPEGILIDPYGGQNDLAAKVLRHVSPAFTEDPLRILRVARFYARFEEFSLAPETLDLMQMMCATGEIDHLTTERVWQELARALMERRPSRCFELLRSCGALARLLPELDALFGVPQRADYHPEIDCGAHVLLALDQAAQLGGNLACRFAVLGHDLGKGTTPAALWPRHCGHEQRSVAILGPLCTRLRVDRQCRELALLVARYHGDIGRIDGCRPQTIVRILERCNAFRRPERFEHILLACEADFRGRAGWAASPFKQKLHWRSALEAAAQVDCAALARQCKASAHIPAAIHAARVRAVERLSWVKADDRALKSA